MEDSKRVIRKVIMFTKNDVKVIKDEEPDVSLEESIVPVPASILKLYLVDNEEDRLIGYIDYNQNKFWIDEDIISFINSRKRRKELKKSIEKISAYELLKCGYCAESFFGKVVSILTEEGYKVKTEYIGGYSLYII